MNGTSGFRKSKAVLASLRFGLNEFRGKYAVKSYAQEGEDLILQRYLNPDMKGFYVDVGAHHPIRFSNTYAFYKSGWSGINIDAMPGSMELFRQLRPRDINIEAAIGSSTKSLTYFVFDEPALNTFDAGLAAQRSTNSYRIVREISLVTRPLHAVLDEHVPEDVEISFMSVDVEGLDLDVLQSNDWTRFRPKFVLAESSGTTAALVKDIQQSDMNTFMASQGYELAAKAYLSLLFKNVK